MGEMAGTNLMKKLTSLLAAVLFLLLAISTAFAGQPADYNKPTVTAGTLVYLSNPRRAPDGPGSPAALLVHQVSDWCSGAAAHFGWVREAKRKNTRCGL